MVYSSQTSELTINLHRRSLTSQWRLGHSETQLVVDEELYHADVCSQLRLLQEKEQHLSYRKVPASLFDIHAYYRAHMMSAAKHLSIWVRYEKFNQVVHQQVFYGFGGGLAVFFIHMFLGVYVPRQHFFVAAMAPLLSGIKVIYVIVGIFELTRFVDICLIYLDFFVTGIFLKNPWNRCDDFPTANYTSYTNDRVRVKCISSQDFYKEMRHANSLSFVYGDGFSCFHTNGRDCFQVPQILFAHSREVYMAENTALGAFYFLLLWGVTIFNNKSIFKKHVWRAVTILQISLVVVHLFVLIHLNLVVNTGRQKVNVKSNITAPLNFDNEVKKWENLQNDVSVFVQVPPVIHVLTARYSKKIKPNRDSAVLLLTNALYFMYNVYVAHHVISYCEGVLGWELRIVTDSFFLNPILYFWFIYFERFSMAMFYTLVYTLLAFLHELFALIITFQCLVEAVTMQFSWLKRWHIVCFVCFSGCILNFSIYKERMILHSYSRCVILVLEIIGVYLLYPLRRLLDDVAFFYGVRPSYMRYISIVVFPIAVAIKSYFSYQLYLEGHSYFRNIKWIAGALIVFLGVPLIVGMIYTIWHTKNKLQIFCPSPTWGPDNYVVRQIRKLFDSRYYIASQAPRVLSRYLMHNAEPEAYKLDIDYDVHRRTN